MITLLSALAYIAFIGLVCLFFMGAHAVDGGGE